MEIVAFGNGAVIWKCAGLCEILGVNGELLLRPDWNVLKVMRAPSNGENDLAGQAACFHEFITESLDRVQYCNVGNIDLDGEIVRLGDTIISSTE